MKTENYRQEKYLTIDQNLLNELQVVELKIREQMKTPGMHYPVAELLLHPGKAFFKMWDAQVFKTYTKGEDKKKVDEYRGIYVFATKKDGDLHYDYVGISRGIRQRFQWHVSGTIKNHATWAWMMLKEDGKVNSKTSKEEIKKCLKTQQEDVINHCLFTFVPIETDMMLHLAEIYCANHLRTHWNSFRD
jgi:hypothetical protein